MEYITHHRFKEIGACNKPLNIPYGTTLETICGFIATFIATDDGKAICYPTSENAHKHFARNDDGNGLERGALTYAIAYGKRKPVNTNDRQIYRFSEEEIRLLETRWKHFLRDDVDVILFNHEFFNADISELREMAKSLKIKIKK